MKTGHEITAGFHMKLMLYFLVWINKSKATLGY